MDRGYEEAACQGMMAGYNAHLAVKEEEPFILAVRCLHRGFDR